MAVIARTPAVEHVLGRHPAHYDANAAAWAGLGAGFCAGALLLAVRALAVTASGVPARFDALRVAAIFLGPSVLGRPLAASAAIALGAHLGLSLAFGLAFGLVAFGWQRATVIWAGLLWGLLVYAFMAFVALPTVSPLLGRSLIGFLPALLHLAFGGVVGLAFEPLRFRSGVTTPAPHRGATVVFQPSA